MTNRDFSKYFSGDREANALIDFELALHAHKFVGNSVSTFSALALYQRRHTGKWSSYYNGGNIPMSEFLPLHQLPWIFPFSSYVPDWEYLAMTAVRSALRHKTLKPYCLWSGNASVPIYKWLVDAGVTMVHHDPAWEEELWKRAEPHQAQYARISPIYSSKESLVDHFRRIDIPILPEFEQYVYVLFTEVDTYFARKVSLAGFSLPLPESLGMASDPDVRTGVDGGVMLLNVPAMRETYDEFRLFILSNRHGMRFDHYGVGAVGAYVQFYEAQLSQGRISQHYAVKPFRDYDMSAHVVHFQGPKPHDYVQYFKTLECAYGQVCELGLRKSLCSYTKKWHLLINETEDEVGLTLWYACLALYAPHLRGLSKHHLAQQQRHL